MAQLFKVLCLSCVIGSLVLATPPGTARAQTDIPAAREAYQRATAEFGLGNYAAAATEYEKAFRHKPDPALLFNAAQAYRLADNKPRALQLYRNYLRLFPTGVAANEARKHVETLEVATTNGEPIVSTPEAPTPVVPTRPTSPAVPNTDMVVSDEAATHSDESLLGNPWFWAGAAAVAIAVTAIVIVASSSSDPEHPDATWGRITVK
jgi:tetratricopeptide (TPR) repeat protein